MAAVIKARRKAPVLTPSSLACLSRMPTINLTAGCLHGCAYCYTRGYSTFPGDGTVIVYENTLDMLRDELARRRKKPQAVYFSPSSDLFQPAREVVELARAVLELLFRSGIGVAFLSKGDIPNDVLALLIDHAELVQAQVGIITVDESIATAFEPNAAGPGRRLEQIEVLVAGGISTEARVDPILPRLTDAPDQVERLFRALAWAGVKRAAAGLLFLRPSIAQSLERKVPDKIMVAQFLAAYQGGERVAIRTDGLSSVRTLPVEARAEIFARMQGAAKAHGIELSVCACKHPDLAPGTCNIAGRWPRLSPGAVQLLLAPEFSSKR